MSRPLNPGAGFPSVTSERAYPPDGYSQARVMSPVPASDPPQGQPGVHSAPGFCFSAAQATMQRTRPLNRRNLN
jgi:hypothetical protein